MNWLRNLGWKFTFEGDTTTIDKFDKKTESTSGKMKKLGKNIDTVGKKTRDLGKATTKLGSAWSKNITAPIMAGGGIFAKIGSDFQKSRATIAGVTGAIGRDLDRLNDSFKKVRKESTLTDDEIANTMSTLHVIADETGSALERLTKQTEDYAMVTSQDAAESATTLGRLMNALEVDVEQLPSVMDKLAMAYQETGINANQLAEYIIDAGPAFEEMGFHLDKSIGLFSQFYKVGAEPREVLSSLNIVMTRMAKEGFTDAESAFNELLQRVKDAPDILTATNIASEAFGARVGGKVADDIRAGHFEVNEWVEALENADGTVAKSAKEMETFGDKAKIFRKEVSSAFEPIGTSLLDSLDRGMESLEPALGVIEGLSERFSDLPTNVQDTIFKVAGFAAALGPALFFGGKLTEGIGKLIPTVDGVGKALKFIRSPAGIAISAIGGLVAAGIHLYKTNDEAREKIDAAWEGIKNIVGSGVEWIQGYWEDHGENIMTIVGAAWDSIQNIFKLGVDIITGTIGIISSLIDGDWRGVWDSAMGIVVGVIDYFKTLPGIMFDTGKAMISSLGKGLKSVGSSIWNGTIGKIPGLKVDGSHRTGLDRVPRDNYLSNLHKDEMVLTKSTSDAYRALGGTKDRLPNYDDYRPTTPSSNTVTNNNGNKNTSFSPNVSINIEVKGSADKEGAKDLGREIRKEVNEIFDELMLKFA